MKSLLTSTEIAGLKVDFGSDFHEALQGKSPRAAATNLSRRLLQAKTTDTLILAGDLFDAEVFRKNHSEFVSPVRALNELLRIIEHSFRNVLYVPGNHCLRRKQRTDDPWKDIDPPKKVVMPRGTTPEIFSVGGVRFLLANLFYDGEFIPSHPLHGSYRQYLAKKQDGQYLLHGADSIPLFRQMTNSVADAITSDIHAVVTHALPHPSSARWRTYAGGEDTVPHGFPGILVKDESEDARILAFYGTKVPASRVREAANKKTIMLGSDVLEPTLGAQPRDGVTFIHGHNHLDESRNATIDGVRMRFLSHQLMQW